MSTKTKHTPGPWRTYQPGDPLALHEEGCILKDLPDDDFGEPWVLARTNQTFNDDNDVPGHWRSNARLMAEAPALKAQLQTLVNEARHAVREMEAAGLSGPAGILKEHILDAEAILKRTQTDA